jgi:uncharacterized protein (TIRG00374 family)
MRHKKILWVLKLLVGVLLIVLIYSQVGQKKSVIEAFTSANPVHILLGIFLLIPNLFLQFLKWRYLLNGHFERIDDALVIKSLLFGATLGFVTPGNLGELGRGLYFREHNKFVVTGLNILDKIFGMLIFITIGLLAFNIIIEIKLFFSRTFILMIHIVSSLLLVIFWILIIHPSFSNNIMTRITRKFSPKSKISLIFSGLRTVSFSRTVILILLNSIWFFIILLQYHVVINSFTPVPFKVSLLAVSATLFTKILLPISLGDLGVREGAAVFYFSLFFVPSSAAFYTSLLLFLINFCFPALMGSYFVFRLKWEQKTAPASWKS